MITNLIQIVNKPDQVFALEVRDTLDILLSIEHVAEFVVKVR